MIFIIAGILVGLTIGVITGYNIPRENNLDYELEDDSFDITLTKNNDINFHNNIIKKKL